MSKRFQVVGIGNALVDVLSNCEDGFLSENGIEKGIMQLIDTPSSIHVHNIKGRVRLGGEGTGRSHLTGRVQIQFGERFGNSVSIAEACGWIRSGQRS